MLGAVQPSVRVAVGYTRALNCDEVRWCGLRKYYKALVVATEFFVYFFYTNKID